MFVRKSSSLIKPIISITDNAWNKMKNISQTQNIKCFLFLAESGGCNGFNYKLELIEKKTMMKS